MRRETGLDRLRWQSANYRQLILREWEGEYFIFNPRSGDTHVLNEVSITMLRLLEGEGLTRDELVDRLREEAGECDREELRHAIGNHLLQLDAMGLVECRCHATPTTHKARD